MADLRLVGVHDDGGHLLLSGPDGDIYLLPLDEALRTAVGRTGHHSSRAPQASGARMTPREIQTLIRSGSNAGDVSAQSGLSLEQVRRYEGPVLAEREYIATQARNVQVATPTPHNDDYKSAFGDSSVTLDEMVTHRLAAFGIDPKSLRWDAWRDHAGTWSVSADFDPGTEWAASSIGEPAPAVWRFQASRKTLHNANRWAQQLSELEPLDSPVPERRLSAVIDQPFDVEADAELAPADTDPASTTNGSDSSDDTVEADHPGRGLLEMLRSRRGVRLGLNEDGDDELAAMLGTHVPGAHPRDETLYGAPETPAEFAEEDTSTAASSAKDTARTSPFLQLAPSLTENNDHALESIDSVGEVSTKTREVVLSGEPVTSLRQLAPAAEPASDPLAAPSTDNTPESHQNNHEDSGPSDSEVAARLERKAAAKPKRSSVPSWDEIVFGTKGD